MNKKNDKPSNLYFVSGSKCQIDYDHNVKQVINLKNKIQNLIKNFSKARKIFNDICPGEEFMPKPPDPEDIIFDEKNEENK